MLTRPFLSRTLATGGAVLVLLACNTTAGEPAGSATASPAAAPRSAAPAPLESLVPDDAFAFFTFAGVGAASRAAEDLGLWQLWREPETQELFAGLIAGYLEAAKGTPAEVEQHWALMKRFLSGRVSFALGGLNLLWTEDGPVPVPGIVMSLDAGSEARALEQFFEQLVAQITADPHVVRTTKTIAGHEVTVLSGLDDVFFELHFTFLGDRLLVGLGPYLFERCLHNVSGTNGTGGTLASAPSFRRARAKAGAEPLIEAWFNVDAFTSRIRGLVPEEILAECRTLGLADLDAIYYASAVKDGDSFDTFYIDAPAPRRGLLALADGKGLSREALSVVPETAAFFTASSWDFAGTWDVVWASLENLLPAVHVEELRSELRGAEQELGFPIRDGLLAALGDELVLYAELPQHGLIPNVVASLGVRDRAAFEGILQRLLGMCGADVSELQYQGHAIRVIHVEGAPFAPALSISDSRALVSLSVPGLKAALTRDPARGIAASPAFRATFAGMDWEKASSIDWFDTPRVVAFGYNLLENMGPAALGSDAPVDLALLPDPATVLAHFRGWGSVGRADEDGLVQHSRTLSFASVLALGSRFLHEAPGVPPHALERLFGGEHRQKVSVAPARSAGPEGARNPYAADDPRIAATRARIEELTAAIDAQPDDASLYLQRGSARHLTGDFLAAADDFRRADRIGEGNATASYNAACCLSLAGLTEEALAELAVALDAGFDRESLLREDSDLDNLRADPRFGDLLGRLE